MKKTFKLLASLTFGLMVASCQNGLEEVINESAVQDELATTRAEDEATSDNAPIVIPLSDNVDELFEGLRYTTALVPLSGPIIIGGTEVGLFSVTLPNDKNIVWSYNTSLLTQAPGSTTTGLRLQLTNSNSTADTYVAVYVYNSDGSLYSYDVKQVGLNGPLRNQSSIRIERSSDGVEVYPTHNGISPNTYYYAYFSTSSGVYNMNLSWTFYDPDVEILNQYGYILYFKTGNDNYDFFLHVDGTMPNYGVSKDLIGISAY